MFSRLATTVARRSAPQVEQKVKEKMEEYTSDILEAKIKQSPHYKKVTNFLENDVTNLINKNINYDNKENVELNNKNIETQEKAKAKMISQNYKLLSPPREVLVSKLNINR